MKSCEADENRIFKFIPFLICVCESDSPRDQNHQVQINYLDFFKPSKSAPY